MKIKFPNPGFVFYPVGTGDSATVCLDARTFMQVDLHHVAESEKDDDPRIPIVDTLVESLPKRNGRPYLSCFVLTHPDKDHCKGFERLLDEVSIDEIWFSPRIFWEFHNGDKDKWCDDAKAFHKEAKRRVALAQKLEEGQVLGAGDRIRIIGYADVIKEKYPGIPDRLITVPGKEVTELNDEDRKAVFRAFVHAPFKDDCAGERNETSVGMQVTLKNDEADGKALLLGDLGYETLCKVFKKVIGGGEDPNVYWDIYLATHHCSKGAMYVREGDKDVLKQDILDAISKSGGELGYIVLSCNATKSRNNAGDNPPHARARNRYEEIAPTRVICTMEEPSEDAPKPIIFDVTDEGMVLRPEEEEKSQKSSIAASATAAFGSPSPSPQPRNFGAR